jgi:hypothetical protein
MWIRSDQTKSHRGTCRPGRIEAPPDRNVSSRPAAGIQTDAYVSRTDRSPFDFFPVSRPPLLLFLSLSSGCCRVATWLGICCRWRATRGRRATAGRRRASGRGRRPKRRVTCTQGAEMTVPDKTSALDGMGAGPACERHGDGSIGDREEEHVRSFGQAGRWSSCSLRCSFCFIVQQKHMLVNFFLLGRIYLCR